MVLSSKELLLFDTKNPDLEKRCTLVTEVGGTLNENMHVIE